MEKEPEQRLWRPDTADLVCGHLPEGQALAALYTEAGSDWMCVLESSL